MPNTTTRRLILLRHAKALDDAMAGDHTRALSERGRADAAAVGAWFQTQGFEVGEVLCSTATRTRQTLELLGQNLPTQLRDKLYLATTSELLAQIQGVDDAVTTVMVVAHNPGLHGLLALLADECVNPSDMDRVVMKFPTAACAVLRFDLAHWADLTRHSGLVETLRWQSES